MRRDSTYAGAIVPLAFYRKDSRVSSVMIELNRGLYLAAPGVRGAGFGRFRAALQNAIREALGV